MSGTIYFERNKDVILNIANKYYGDNKEVSRQREQEINTENYLKKKIV